ncbi:MAG TPA: DUF6786 family protein [Puia sp.]|nr:DUF6786 family protein [Puia sp.]
MKERIFQEGTFGYDLDFLSRHDNVIVLTAKDPDVRVIVSAKYQAKVFTSTAEGEDGRSFGWVNYKAFSGAVDAHMNAYGGENRFWLGPEGGPFSIFFKPGDEMVFENWKTPAAVDTEAWTVVSRSGDEVRFWKDMVLTNYRGTVLKLLADRRVKILERGVIATRLGLELTDAVRVVGYDTDNSITNKGDAAWTEASGVPCIWMLDMFRPSPQTVVVVPFKAGKGDAFEKIVTSNYFGEIGADRLKHDDGAVFFKADGRSRGKLGIRPENAKTVAGSYDAGGKVLTIVVFEMDGGARYLNQEWSVGKPPFLGDAVNAYNDGPLDDGSQMGPFYEIESVSPAAFLAPGEKMTHAHAVFHFTGEESGLDVIARKLLGSSLADIKNKF